ncbi:MAG: thermosome subunit alpha [Nitrosopumilus sp.]|nr:thermosome subunit alpha [Nitrosopumilus sp.]MDH3822879.1 thermosome subunit alpha [Nitrosopumilus sp.]MDH3833312.1 thermosome subunit alpha [Nitrosopumilus sp.]
MKYPDLLDQDISRVGLQDSQKYNLISGKLVTEIVKTSLGPRGMEKMYIDILGEDTITKHGGAFLRKVDVVHPAAKSVIDAVNTVDTHVGDGTTSAAVLIGSLLNHAEELLKIGIPVAAITRGYERSLDCALEILNEIKIKSNRRDRKTMKQLLATCLEGKAIFDLQEENMKIIDIIIEAICQITNLERGKINVDDIKIEEKIGNLADIELIKGTIIDKTIDSSAMPRSIKDAKILLINEPLEPMRSKTEAEIEIESPEQMSQFLDQENKDLLAFVKKITDSGATVVISRKGVNEFVQEALAKKGIISMRRVKYNDLWWLEKATGAKTCENIEKISNNELGFAKKVYEKTIGGDKMMFVEAGNNPKSVTLLLRANSKRYLDEFHRNALNAFYVLRNFIENPFIVYGAGSAEWIVAQKIREQSVTVEGKEQIAIERFADAVEQIPLTLARNIGMNELDTLTQLRTKSSKSNGKMKWYGIDSNTRKVLDTSSSEIIETVVVKQQVFKTAVEATNMILNIDDVFMKDLIDNTHCHIDGTVHAHHDGGKSHNHFEQEGLEQRQMHHYY